MPQFIDIEDKIFGPLTFKQFVYLLGGAGGSYVLWVLLPKTIALLFILPVAGLALALAFYKINNKSFMYVLESFFRFASGTRLYIWKPRKNASKKKVQAVEEKKEELSRIPKLTESRLEDISWSLDILDMDQTDE